MLTFHRAYLKAIYLLYHMIWFYLVQFFYSISSIVNYGAFGSSLAFNLVRFMILFIFFLSSIASHAKKALCTWKNMYTSQAQYRKKLMLNILWKKIITKCFFVVVYDMQQCDHLKPLVKYENKIGTDLKRMIDS